MKKEIWVRDHLPIKMPTGPQAGSSEFIEEIFTTAIENPGKFIEYTGVSQPSLRNYLSYRGISPNAFDYYIRGSRNFVAISDRNLSTLALTK